MNFRCLLAAALSAAAITAKADAANPMYMVVSLTDGSLKVVNVDAVDRITFSSSSMKASDKSGGTVAEYQLSSLSQIEFNEDGVTGIESVTTEEVGISFDPQSALLRVLNAKNGNLAIYNMSGQLVLSTPIANPDTTIDVSQLISGVYLVKYSDVTLKITKK